MKRNKPSGIAATAILAAALSFESSPAADLGPAVEKELPSLLKFYRTAHANPELSYFEKNTAERLAAELARVGFDVTSPMGRYPDQGLTCYGVVAVLKNGAGPTVLVRTDTDALPVEEKTGAQFASKVRMADESGAQVSVMHACGHDLHQTVLVGAARVLAAQKDRWHGTLILIGQPDEERGGGARALLADGLYKRWPVPDYALAEHVDPSLEAGQIGYCAGWAMANIDMLDITVYGIGSHGAQPHLGKDPIVLSTQIINGLQTLVSRSINPVEVGVVTVGSIHGGSKHNIIPDEVKLQLTVRSFKDDVRRTLLEGIERIAVGTARAYGLPEDRLPVVHNREQEFFPALYNDPQLVERTVGALRKELGDNSVVEILPTTGGEDFSEFGRTEHKVPIFMFRVGTALPGSDPKTRPGLHSARFLPEAEPGIRTGVRALTAAVLDLMG
ncbi:MAG: amidohydrolase, partial [Candidatus Glassbacteria bacterium]